MLKLFLILNLILNINILAPDLGDVQCAVQCSGTAFRVTSRQIKIKPSVETHLQMKKTEELYFVLNFFLPAKTC